MVQGIEEDWKRVLKFWRGLIATLIGIALAAIAGERIAKSQLKQLDHDARAKTAKRDHNLGQAHKEKTSADKFRKATVMASARAKKRIENAATRHETPSLDTAIADYNNRMRALSSSRKPVG